MIEEIKMMIFKTKSSIRGGPKYTNDEVGVGGVPDSGIIL